MSKAGNIETERIVLSHYLVRRAADIRDAQVTAEHFFHGKHGVWWETAVSAPQSWTPGDMREAGLDPDTMALLAAIRPSPEEVNRAEKRMVRHWQVTYVQRFCRELSDEIKEGDVDTPDGALDRMRRALADAESGGVVEARTHRDVGIDLFREWSDSLKSDERKTLPMPLRKLNERLLGWQRGKLYLVGAVTSGHKTTFARQAAWHVAKAGYRSLFWPMEDTAEEMAARTFAAEIKQADTRTFTTFQRPEGITQDDFADLIHNLGKHLDSPSSVNLRYLDEGLPKLTRVLGRLSAEAARGLDFAALDFMQLIQPDDPSTHEVQHWFTVANALAAAAKRLNIALVATVQPTQAATREQARNQKPLTLGDLRGGSAIAQSAYGVLLLNRVWDEDGEIDRRYLDVDVAKWKNADPGRMRYNVERSNDVILD
jgi:replicative DNA helicase